jgi:hypothetical protein
MALESLLSGILFSLIYKQKLYEPQINKHSRPGKKIGYVYRTRVHITAAIALHLMLLYTALVHPTFCVLATVSAYRHFLCAQYAVS